MGLQRIGAVALVMGVLVVACATQPKQARPDLKEFQEGSDDLAAEPEGGPEPIILTPEQKQGICCQQCDAAMQNDKTGDPPEKIPCADFTADLKEDCLKLFRKTPMMASEAKGCAANAPPPKGEPGGEATDG